MSGTPPKGLMRSLGEFVGHIVKAVRTDPAKPDTSDQSDQPDQPDQPDQSDQPDQADQPTRVEVNRTTEVVEQNDVILRRTTIDEVEVKRRPGT